MLPQAPSRLLPAQLRPSHVQVCQVDLSLPKLSLPHSPCTVKASLWIWGKQKNKTTTKTDSLRLRSNQRLVIVARTRGQSERGPGEGSLAGGPLRRSPTGPRPGSQSHLVKPPAPVTCRLGLPSPQLLHRAGPGLPLCGVAAIAYLLPHLICVHG